MRANLQRIAGTVDRLGRLTSRLKTFAYKSEEASVPVSLLRSIADALAVVGAEVRDRGIDIEVDVEPVDLSVMAEEAAIGSVIINLVRNAIDAMQDASTRKMLIRARSEHGRVLMHVTDTGPGIRADILPRLFEPFVTSKPAGAGLGLGLVISAQVVRARVFITRSPSWFQRAA